MLPGGQPTTMHLHIRCYARAMRNVGDEEDQKRAWTCAACHERDVIPGVCLFLESCSGSNPTTTHRARGNALRRRENS